MLEKIVTAFVISSLAAVSLLLYRRDFLVSDEMPLRKITAWICLAYVAGITLVYIKMQVTLSHFFLMLVFLPVLYLAYDLFHRSQYRGSMNILLTAVVLTVFGLLTLFRIGKSANNLLSSALMMNGPIPMAFNHLVYSAAGIILSAWLVSSGRMGRLIDLIDRRTSTAFWAILCFVVLMIPWVLKKAGLGGSSGQTAGWLLTSKSGQISEVVFKLFVIVFIGKFLAARAMQMNRFNDWRDVLKNVCVLIFLVFAVFFVPIAYFQKELGTCLLITFSAIAMVFFATSRKYYLVVGLLLVILAFAAGALVSDHVRERLVGSFLEWEHYAFRFFEGSRSGLFPGFQIFQVLSSVKGSHIWGAGLTNGFTRISQVTNDVIGAPIIEELGFFALLILVSCYLLFLKKGYGQVIRPDFRGFLSVGIPVMILIQAFYVLSATVHLLPLMGVPLPFISNGGTSVLSTWVLVGVMTEIQGRPTPVRR